MPTPNKAQGIVYAVQGNWMVKIGWTVDLRRRLQELQCGSPIKLELIFAMHGTGQCERDIQFKLHRWRRHGEWFEAHLDLITYLCEIRERGGPLIKLAPVVQSITPDGSRATTRFRDDLTTPPDKMFSIYAPFMFAPGRKPSFPRIASGGSRD